MNIYLLIITGWVLGFALGKSNNIGGWNSDMGQNRVKGKKLLEQVRDKIRLKHYSIRTEKMYTDCIKRYIYFHGKKHPKEMRIMEVESF